MLSSAIRGEATTGSGYQMISHGLVRRRPPHHEQSIQPPDKAVTQRPLTPQLRTCSGGSNRFTLCASS
jgi:hypothetical protein